MGFEKEKIKQIRNLILLVAGLIFLLMYSQTVLNGIAVAFNIMKPFIYGGIIAFVLNVPMRGIEQKLLAKWKGKSAEKFKRPVSILLSILFVCAIITIVIAAVVPQVTQTFIELSTEIPPFVEGVVEQLEEVSADYPQLQCYLEEIDISEFNCDSLLNSLVSFAKNGMTSMLTSTVLVASNIIGGIVNIFIAFIFALYILGQKEKLANQAKRILTAYASEKVNHTILKICSLLHQNFTNFISGQCVEAVILGTMFVIAMSIFRMPYAILVGVLIAFTALIPIVGAFIGCAVGAFLILVDTPEKAFWFIILFLILQQIEGNLIYPHVVGSSVGLPAIWVLVAVTLGGNLMGIVGMLIFIPLVSVCYTLFREWVYDRLKRKKITVV